MQAYIDLRSDTVTKPSKEMLLAMCRAQVGDDVFGDDPSVNALQEYAADLLGMEAALFCPSGTMTNQIAINVHTRPGDEVICEQNAHVYLYEGGGIAKNSGASVQLVSGVSGILNAESIALAIKADDAHFPKSSLVCLENTSNKGGGTCYPMGNLLEIKKLCKEKNLALHLDGARLFNALVATGQNANVYGGIFDSISICLSKGLGCPVGSLLLGSKAFIKRAHRVRKVFGGGMRQAGFLAAAGSYALENNIDRLAEDHLKASQLQQVLIQQKWVVSAPECSTNIVVAYLASDEAVASVLSQLKDLGILAVRFGPKAIRFVTHIDIDDYALECTMSTLEKVG